MIMSTVSLIVSLMVLAGCTAHTPDPNLHMMDKVMGELDHETSK